MKSILCFGSMNIDYVYSLFHAVEEGETVFCNKLDINAGGKGLNQASALKKAGADVVFAGIRGRDGKVLSASLLSSGLDESLVRTVETPSGHAIIQVDNNGDNRIIVYGGANKLIDRDFTDTVLSGFGKGDILVLQNEISCLSYIIDAAGLKEMYTVFTPAPFQEDILTYPLEKISLFALKETEGKAISGLKNGKPDDIISNMRKRFPNASVLLTLGSNGAIFSETSGAIHFQPAIKVKAIDTTAAGDTFLGYFLALFQKGEKIEKALEYAAAAAAVSVTRKGAAVSVPEFGEIEEYLKHLSD